MNGGDFDVFVYTEDRSKYGSDSGISLRDISCSVVGIEIGKRSVNSTTLDVLIQTMEEALCGVIFSKELWNRFVWVVFIVAEIIEEYVLNLFVWNGFLEKLHA